MEMEILYQYNEQDCGVASLAMLFNYYSNSTKVTISDITAFVGRRPTTLYDLATAAQKIGFDYEAFSMEDINEIAGCSVSYTPFIAHTVREDGLGHFVVVVEYADNGIKVMDPEIGEIVYSVAQFEDIWSGVILHVVPSVAFPVQIKSKNHLLNSLRDALAHKGLLLYVLLLSVLVSFLGAASATFFQYFLDTVLPSGNFRLLLESTIVLSCLYVFLHSIDALREKKISVFKYRFRESIIKKFLQAVKKTSHNQDRRSLGDITSRFMDLEEVIDSVPELILQFSLQVITIVVGGFILANFNIQIFTIVSLVCCCQFCAAITFNKPVIRRLKHLKGCNNGMQNLLISVYHSGRIEKTGEAWQKKWCESYYKTERMMDTRNVVLSILESIQNIAILLFGGIAVINGYASIGSIFSGYILSGYITSSLLSLLGLYTIYQNAATAAERLADL